MALTAEDKNEIMEMLKNGQEEIAKLFSQIPPATKDTAPPSSTPNTPPAPPATSEPQTNTQTAAPPATAEQWYREQLSKALEINQQLAIHTNLGAAQKTPDEMLTEMFARPGTKGE